MVFTKDNEDDFYNVNVVNANLDKIDTEMKRIEDAIQPISPTDSVKWIGTVGGTVNALTATHVEITSYSDGLGVSFAANANSTVATTLDINGLGAIPIKKANGTAFSNAKANGVYTVRYRDGAFILQGESEVEIGRQIITPSTMNQAITQGVHDGTGYVVGSPNLLPQNIKKGVSMFNVTGAYDGEMSGFGVEYLMPITTAIPITSPLYTIPMNGWRMAYYLPDAGPSGERDMLNGGSYPTFNKRVIYPDPGYGTDGILSIIVNTNIGAYTYPFPKNKGYAFMPHFMVYLSGTTLYLRAYYEYDKPTGEYSAVASAQTISATLANGVTSLISIQFKMSYTETQNTGVRTNVYGTVYKIS